MFLLADVNSLLNMVRGDDRRLTSQVTGKGQSAVFDISALRSPTVGKERWVNWVMITDSGGACLTFAARRRTRLDL
jgi:hypothetical protein